MFRELRANEETENIPVIIVTGISKGEQFEERIMRQDFNIPAPQGYIQKPMKPWILLKLVNGLLS